MSSYRVLVTREDGHWIAEAAELPLARTWAGNLIRLDTAIREAIALAADLPAGAERDLQLIWDYSAVTPEAVAAARLAAERVEMNARAEEITARTTELARTLVAAGWSVRDAAGLLQISPGRISQLAGRGT